MPTAAANQGFSFRSLVLGCILCLAIATGSIYNLVVIRGSYMTIDFTTAAALFLLFPLVVGNLVLKKTTPRCALRTPELGLVYSMMTIACSIPTMGLTLYLLPGISGLFYYAMPENKWAELLHPYVKSWMVLQDEEAIRTFYEGLAPDTPIPWGAWARPLIAWGIFLLAFYVVMICIVVILRKQWMERDRLVYPLTLAPLEMIKQDATTHPFLKSKLMWIGFLIPFTVGSMIGLHHYFNFIPAPVLYQSVAILRRSVGLQFRLSFPMIGFTYFVSQDLALSLWLFSVLITVQQGIFNMLGIGSARFMPYNAARPLLAWQCLGGLMVLVCAGLWLARSHLRDVVRKALSNDAEIDDSSEIMSYRTAFWGVIIGFVIMTVWLCMSGLPLWIALILLFFAFAIFIGITRVVCEGGLAATRAPIIAPLATVAVVGSSTIGCAGLVALGFSFVYASDVRTFVMASAANSLKLAEGTRGGRKWFLIALIVAVVVTLIASVWTTLVMAYGHGGVNANSWFFVSGPQYPWRYVVEEAHRLKGPDWDFLGFMGIGAVFTIFLSFMRYHFLWWPFHPLGFAFGSVMMTNALWFSIFLSWLFKALLLKYGGVKVFTKAKYFFLGLIVGQFVCNGTWLIIDCLVGGSDNVIFWA